MDGESYVRSEGATPQTTKIQYMHPLYVYKIEVEQSDFYSDIIGIPKIRVLCAMANVVLGMDDNKRDKADPRVVGTNGNWWIDGVDSGQPSRGQDGTNIACKVAFNVSQYNNVFNYADASTARNTIPANLRGLGQQITYKLASGKWVTEQYIGADLNGWTTVSNWEQNPTKEDLDSKVNITDLPLDSASKKDYGNETVSGKTGGDTNIALYANYPIDTNGSLIDITVSLAVNTTITPYAISVINNVCTILHTYKSITGIAETNLYAIDSFSNR